LAGDDWNRVNARWVSPFQNRVCSKAARFNIIYGAKRNVIADSDTITRGNGTYLASFQHSSFVRNTSAQRRVDQSTVILPTRPALQKGGLNMPNNPTSTGSEPARMGGDGLTAPDLKQDEQKKDSRDEKLTSTKNKLPNPFLRRIKDPDRIEETD
jgi:hypothetical protein